MWLREDSRRDRADNKSTIYLSGAGGGRGSVEMLSPQVFRDRFIRYYDAVPNIPVVIGTTSAQISTGS